MKWERNWKIERPSCAQFFGISVGGTLVGSVATQQMKRIIGSAKQIITVMAHHFGRTFYMSRIKSMLPFTRQGPRSDGS